MGEKRWTQRLSRWGLGFWRFILASEVEIRGATSECVDHANAWRLEECWDWIAKKVSNRVLTVVCICSLLIEDQIRQRNSIIISYKGFKSKGPKIILYKALFCLRWKKKRENIWFLSLMYFVHVMTVDFLLLLLLFSFRSLRRTSVHILFTPWRALANTALFHFSSGKFLLRIFTPHNDEGYYSVQLSCRWFMRWNSASLLHPPASRTKPSG